MTSLNLLRKLGISLAATLAFVSVSNIGHAQCFKQNLGGATVANHDHQEGDYKTLSNAPGFTCKPACEVDAKCVAWTYVASNRTCYLKDQIGALVPAPGMTTGRKFEPDTSYNGSDYRQIPSSTTPATCHVACMGDSKCKAWTWVQSNSTCYLKDAIPAKSAAPGMVSTSYGPEECMY